MAVSWGQTAGVPHVLDHPDNSHLHVEVILNLLFCVAVRMARTTWLCSLPWAYMSGTLTVHNNAGPVWSALGPAQMLTVGNAGNNGSVAGGLGCFHWALAAPRENSICHFASHPCGLTSYHLHLHPSPNFTSHPETLNVPTPLECSLAQLFCIHCFILIFDAHNSSERWLDTCTMISVMQVRRPSSGGFILFPKVTVSKWWAHEISFLFQYSRTLQDFWYWARVTISKYCCHNCIT